MLRTDTTTDWVREQERRAYAAGERRRVLDEVVELLERLERAATATYDYEVEIWMAELERVTTMVLPASPQ